MICVDLEERASLLPSASWLLKEFRRSSDILLESALRESSLDGERESGEAERTLFQLLLEGDEARGDIEVSSLSIFVASRDWGEPRDGPLQRLLLLGDCVRVGKVWPEGSSSTRCCCCCCTDGEFEPFDAGLDVVDELS